MKAHVTYLLGAGFSAPLGLPVMSNFLAKAKDQFAAEPGGYASFKEIFGRVDSLAKAKNFFAADLFNIEEILSLLEMDHHIRGDLSHDAYVEFLRDVIAYHTPQVERIRPLPGNWHEHAWGDGLQKLYGAFVGSLLDVALEPTNVQRGARAPIRAIPQNSQTRYAVVSVNYDLVLENYASFLASEFSLEPGFIRAESADADLESGPLLAKLHGSMDGPGIVPPTWSKGMYPGIMAEWKLAHRVLSRSKHIRILGYSLPESDAYVRYLLKSAALASENLQSIDGTVGRRYSNFVALPGYRFKSGRVEGYLEVVDRTIERRREGLRHAGLEAAHEQYFADTKPPG